MYGITICKKNYMSRQNEAVHSVEFTITKFKLLKEKAVIYSGIYYRVEKSLMLSLDFLSYS